MTGSEMPKAFEPKDVERRWYVVDAEGQTHADF